MYKILNQFNVIELNFYYILGIFAILRLRKMFHIV